MGLFGTKCKECGHRVKSGANFCPMCREPVGAGVIKCGQCGQELRNDRKFCGKCGAPVERYQRPMIVDDRWARQEGDFAARFDNDDVKGFLAKPFVVESGTRALLLQRGKIKKQLDAGTYNLGGLLQEINNFLVDRDSTLIVAEAGNVTIDLQNDDLFSSDSLTVTAVERVIFRLADPEAFYINVFKSARLLRVPELHDELAGEVQMILRTLVSQYTAEQLSKELSILNELQEQLQQAIAVTLGQIGLELIQLRFISFRCGDYDAVREEGGEVSVAEMRANLQKRLRETLTQDKMDAFRSEKELDEFIRQTEHEMGMKDIVRADEMDRMKQKFTQNLQVEDLLHGLELDGMRKDHGREQQQKDFTQDLSQRDATHGQDMKEAASGMDNLERMHEIRHKKKMQKVTEEEALLKVRSEATAEALLSILDGPAAERIADLEALRAKEKMTPEQILAITAQGSPEAAKALAEKYRAEGQASEKLLRQMQDQMAKQEKLSGEYADRMERIQSEALRQMGHVAGVKAQPTPVPHTQVTGATTSVVLRACEKCGQNTDSAGKYCEHCGEKL